MEPNIVDIYNVQAQTFAAYAPQSFTLRHIEIPAFDKHLSRFYQLNPKVLDVGCGSGRVMKLLSDRGITPDGMTGVDGCSELLAIGKKELPNAQFICQDLRSLCLPSNDYELVTSLMVFQCFGNEDLRLTLQNIHDHMACNGTLFFIVTHPIRELKHLSDYLDRRWITVTSPWGTDLQNYHRPISDYFQLLNENGFLVEVIDELHVPASAQEADPEKYFHYAKLGAVRIAIRARKL